MLVGRQGHRAALEDAMAAMCQGRTVAVFLRGASGAGKTTLLQSFLDEHLERGDALILAGRCYERESVPYKAFDSVIDALGRHLMRLTDEERAAVMPRDMESLARLFPGLRRIEATSRAIQRASLEPGPPGAAPPRLRRAPRAARATGRPAAPGRGHRRPAMGRRRQRGAPLRAAPSPRPAGPALPGDLSRRGSLGEPLPQHILRVRDARRGPEAKGGDGTREPALDCRELEVEPLSDREARELVMATMGPTSASSPAVEPGCHPVCASNLTWGGGGGGGGG